jgi:hypothetical protein
MKRFIIILTTAFIVLSSYSQESINYGYYIDGIKNTDNYYYGTARSMALGGAFSSLGGDLGSVQINPAGLGVYRNSEFVITPGISSLNTSSKFSGTKTDNLDYRFTLSNVGMVFNFKTNNSNGWEGANLAFGFNKMNNLNNTYLIKGNTSNASLMNEFANYANNTPPSSLDSYWEAMAYDGYVLDLDTNSAGYHYTSPFIGKNLQQLRTIESTGSIGEYYMGFGANYNHKLYLGVSINIRSGYYKEEYWHKEIDIDNAIPFNNFTFNNSLYSWIRGWNAKFGAIYRPIETIRVGFSIHTPTIVDVEQELSTSMQVVDDNNYKNNLRPTDLDYNPIGNSVEKYSITTPLRLIGGIAYMFQDKGLISFDYEYADYSKIQLSNGTYPEDLIAANEDNKKALRATHNFRTGAEAKLNSFYLRGGFAYYASPYAKGELNKDANRLIYSGGVGYRNNNFSIDFGYSLLTKSENYILYNDVNLQPTILKTQTGTFLLTAGFKF